MTTIALKDMQAHLIDRGSGPPTLLLHGNPDSGEMWQGLIELLEPLYRCLAPDLPGFGRSTAPPGYDCSLPAMAGFVDELLGALGVSEPINLVGHDFGGLYGLAWAVGNPTRLRRLAIINTSFFSDYRWHFWGRLWRTPLLGELSMALLTEPVLRASLRSSSPGLSDEHIRRTYAAFTPAVRRMALRHYRASDPANFRGWEERLPQLTAQVPTCVLWGDRDPFINKSYAERFGAQRVYHFAEYGHWLPTEAPDAVAARLLTFLA